MEGLSEVPSWGLFWEVVPKGNPRKRSRPRARRTAYDGTLLEAIEAGVVPRPGRLGYHAWNACRAHEGMRPSRRRHGDPATTTTAEEAELWRIVMRSLYGEEWEDDHEEEEEKEEEAEDLE